MGDNDLKSVAKFVYSKSSILVKSSTWWFASTPHINFFYDCRKKHLSQSIGFYYFSALMKWK